MQLHLFRGPGRIFGVTPESSGANLPTRYAPWSSLKSLDVEKGAVIPGLDVDDCLQDIATYGVHVTDAHVRITEKALGK